MIDGSEQWVAFIDWPKFLNAMEADSSGDDFEGNFARDIETYSLFGESLQEMERGRWGLLAIVGFNGEAWEYDGFGDDSATADLFWDLESGDESQCPILILILILSRGQHAPRKLAVDLTELEIKVEE